MEKRQRIGIFLPTWVGDVVMATPTFRAMRNAFPDCELVGVMRPVMADLLAGTSFLDEHLFFDKKKRPGLPTRMGLVSALRAAKLDSMVLLTNSLWTAAVARLAGIPRIIGYHRDARGWFLTDKLPVPKAMNDLNRLTDVPTIDYYLGLAEYVGCQVNDRRSELVITPPESALAEQLWASCQFDSSVPTIVINNNTATEPSRLWSSDNVRDLAITLAHDYAYQVLLHCGPSERERANKIADQINHPLVASMGRSKDLPIGLTKAVLASATAVVSTDSGPRHIAVALNRPVIGLFGPTDPFVTRTYNIAETVLTVDLPCRPCCAKACPLKHGQCMKDLSVQTVAAAVKNAVSRPWSKVAVA